MNRQVSLLPFDSVVGAELFEGRVYGLGFTAGSFVWRRLAYRLRLDAISPLLPVDAIPLQAKRLNAELSAVWGSVGGERSKTVVRILLISDSSKIQDVTTNWVLDQLGFDPQAVHAVISSL